MRITKKYLNDMLMSEMDCLFLGEKHGKSWWVNYSRMEEDVMYYNFGYEEDNPKDENDVKFTSITIRLVSIEDFLDSIRDMKRYIKHGG